MIYETGWLDSFPIEFKPKFYKRYVDGIFVMFRSKVHVKKFVDQINTKHSTISFTFDKEDQNSFSLLVTKNYQKHLENNF